MTGQILANGTNSFTGIVDKLGNITTEFVPYLIYIGIAVLGVALTFRVVKWILGYLKSGTMNTVGESRERRKFKKFIGMRNRRNRRRFNRRHRNRPQRYNKIRYELNERR